MTLYVFGTKNLITHRNIYKLFETMFTNKLYRKLYTQYETRLRDIFSINYFNEFYNLCCIHCTHFEASVQPLDGGLGTGPEKTKTDSIKRCYRAVDSRTRNLPRSEATFDCAFYKVLCEPFSNEELTTVLLRKQYIRMTFFLT